MKTGKVPLLLGVGCVVVLFAAAALLLVGVQTAQKAIDQLIARFATPSEGAAATGVCAEAISCCETLMLKGGGNAVGAGSCQALRLASESSCGKALASYAEAASNLDIDCGATKTKASGAVLAAAPGAGIVPLAPNAVVPKTEDELRTLLEAPWQVTVVDGRSDSTCTETLRFDARLNGARLGGGHGAAAQASPKIELPFFRALSKTCRLGRVEGTVTPPLTKGRCLLPGQPLCSECTFAVFGGVCPANVTLWLTEPDALISESCHLSFAHSPVQSVPARSSRRPRSTLFYLSPKAKLTCDSVTVELRGQAIELDPDTVLESAEQRCVEWDEARQAGTPSE
jgi:hypothetical protein